MTSSLYISILDKMNPLPKLITRREDSGVQFRANNQRYEESIHIKEDKQKYCKSLLIAEVLKTMESLENYVSLLPPNLSLGVFKTDVLRCQAGICKRGEEVLNHLLQ